MTEYFEDTAEVVVLVLRNRAEDADYYLIVKDQVNGFWEFPGGKVKKDEPLEEAAFRKLEDELSLDWDLEEVEIVREGEPLESPEDSAYTLHPVIVEITGEAAWKLGPEHLSREHSELKWIRLDELEYFETLGEEQIIEDLGLV